MDWDKKVWWHGPIILDNRLSENVQGIRKIHKTHHGSHETQENGINKSSTNTCWGQNPMRHFPGRIDLAITICYSNGATQLYT